MALIQCRECGKQYSTQAAACPVCACPTVRADRDAGGGAIPVVTTAPVVTEATGKHWKRLQLVGILMMLGSCVAIIGSAGGSAKGDTSGSMIGGGLFLAGVVAFIYGRAMAWWHHG